MNTTLLFVQTVLKLINDWAERHPKEIVILALSNFQDFEKKKSQLHNHLISFIKTLFGAKLVTRRVKYVFHLFLLAIWLMRCSCVTSLDIVV